MKVEQAIVDLCADDTALTAAVGNRITPVIAAQNSALPYVVYTLISSTPHDTNQGVSSVDDYRVQFDVYAATYQSAVEVYEKLRTAIDKKRGQYGPTGTYIDGIRYMTHRSDYEAEVKLYRVTADFLVKVK